jgi:hypothetical protein
VNVHDRTVSLGGLMSHTVRTLVVAGGCALTLGAAGTGLAVAAGSTTPQDPAATTTVTEVVYPADYPPEPAAPVEDTAAVAPAPVAAVAPAPAADSPEVESPSDGPGGHQDPPGDVNHEFDGVE